MGRRRTSRVRTRNVERRLEMRVRSPRIFGFGVLRFFKSLLKFSLLLAVMGGAVWGSKEGLRSFFIDNQEFQLQQIELETNGRMTETHFGELAGIDPTASVFAISLGEVRAKLEAVPGIVRAEVSRRLPGTLRIRIEERVPVAWLECRPLGVLGRDPATGFLLDAEGVCFPCEAWWAESARGLPVVMISQAETGDVLPGRKLRHRKGRRALSLVCQSRRELPPGSWSLEVVAVRNEYALLAATSGGAWVTFGMYDHQRQLRDLVVLQGFAAKNHRNLAEVNLIPKRNTPVRFAEEDASKSKKMWLSPENRLERDIHAILNRG